MAPLAKVGVEIEVAWHLILQAPVRPLRLRPIKEQNVGAFRIFPGMSASLLRQFLQPPLRGVVLETYGAGNIPATRTDVLEALQGAIERGVVIINCTQCAKGSVSSAYESGSVLSKIGVISGADLTIEAALTKLAYILSQPDVAFRVHIPTLDAKESSWRDDRNLQTSRDFHFKSKNLLIRSPRF